MKIYRITAAFLLIVLSIATFSGCTTFDNFKTAFIDKPEENTATILIGVYEPMTGVDSERSQAEIEGIELAHEMYPTVNGKFVPLEYADTRFRYICCGDGDKGAYPEGTGRHSRQLWKRVFHGCGRVYQ